MLRGKEFYCTSKMYRFRSLCMNCTHSFSVHSFINLLASIAITPFPIKPLFLRVCSASLLNNFFFSHIVFYPFKELFGIFIKLKVVFCKVFQFGKPNICCLGKGYFLLPPYHTVTSFNDYGKVVFITWLKTIFPPFSIMFPKNKPPLFYQINFRCLQKLSNWTNLTLSHEIATFENIAEKGENAGNQCFILFRKRFLPYQRQKSSFGLRLFCRLQMLSIWSHRNFCRLVKS